MMRHQRKKIKIKHNAGWHSLVIKGIMHYARTSVAFCTYTYHNLKMAIFRIKGTGKAAFVRQENFFSLKYKIRLSARAHIEKRISHMTI